MGCFFYVTKYGYSLIFISISGRYLAIDVGLIFHRRWGFYLLTTEDGFSFILRVDCLTLYLDDTDIILLVMFTVVDDFSLILGSVRYLIIDCLALY